MKRFEDSAYPRQFPSMKRLKKIEIFAHQSMPKDLKALIAFISP